MPKGESIEQFADSMHLVLDLADKYPRDSLNAHILDVIALFLPALLMTCSRRDRVIVSNVHWTTRVVKHLHFLCYMLYIE